MEQENNSVETRWKNHILRVYQEKLLGLGGTFKHPYAAMFVELRFPELLPDRYIVSRKKLDTVRKAIGNFVTELSTAYSKLWGDFSLEQDIITVLTYQPDQVDELPEQSTVKSYVSPSARRAIQRIACAAMYCNIPAINDYSEIMLWGGHFARSLMELLHQGEIQKYLSPLYHHRTLRIKSFTTPVLKFFLRASETATKACEVSLSTCKIGHLLRPLLFYCLDKRLQYSRTRTAKRKEQRAQPADEDIKPLSPLSQKAIDLLCDALIRLIPKGIDNFIDKILDGFSKFERLVSRDYKKGPD